MKDTTSSMLQQNNNNNYPCLDMTHRELLQGCGHTNTPFSSALGFGAIPLIKGLRAWAVSGRYSRSRRRAAPAPQISQLPQDSLRIGQRAWTGQVAGGHRKSQDSIASFRTPGVRQGGLGALVTVATLKGSEGGRQTQTRCLFLKAEGCSYLCAVGDRAPGGQWTHTVGETRRSSQGRRGSEDETTACEVKPQAVRKWRKSGKIVKSTEISSTAESKADAGTSKQEQGRCSRGDTFTSQLDVQRQASTGISDFDETQCLKAKHRHPASSIEPSPVNHKDQDQMVKKDEAHLCRSEQSSLNKKSEPGTCGYPASKVESREGLLSETMLDSGHKLSACEVDMGQEIASLKARTDESLDDSKCRSDLVANFCLGFADYKGTNSVRDLTESKEPGPESEVLQGEIDNRKEGTELSQAHGDNNEDCSVAPTSCSSSEHAIMHSVREEHKFKYREHEDSLNCENNYPDDVIHSGDSKEEKGLGLGSTTLEGEDPQCHMPCHVSVKSDLGEGHMRSPVCSSEYAREVNTEFETPAEQFFAKSPSRGTGSLKAAASSTASASVPNPAPTTTSDNHAAIATALPALSSQLEVGTGGGNVGLQADSVLLSEQEGGLNGDKVATDKRSDEVGEEEEDDFGVFMQAGEEQIWTDGFNELQQVPCGKHDGIELKNTSDANEPMSWISDWTGVQSFPQSEATWTAFKQESDSGGREREITSGGQWWSPNAAENTKLTLSSLQNVPNVFLEAFPAVETSCRDADCIPTLKELLQGPAEMSMDRKPGSQSLLDGLQDLDQMIDVKYKKAESLSRKLLFQSLHLGTPNPDHITGHRQATARFSPNLPTSNQQLAAKAKRRLSYDINRNIMA